MDLIFIQRVGVDSHGESRVVKFIRNQLKGRHSKRRHGLKPELFFQSTFTGSRGRVMKKKLGIRNSFRVFKENPLSSRKIWKITLRKRTFFKLSVKYCIIRHPRNTNNEE
ncbi:unnamed protein product [Allacma fusca]|uniref:Uncharacterized protein n=1 Tax=Allacma fusca TaxID=39272 RepID=A0A8J2JBM2_9HEXA|nr:unnamed protein product [Allacma fusca]